jgi:hypothetical protein
MSRIALGFLGQLLVVLLGHCVRRVAHMQSEHVFAGICVRQRDVDPFLEMNINLRPLRIRDVLLPVPHLKSAANCSVEHPGNVGGAQHQNSLHVVAHALHLHQKLGLYAPSRLRFVVGSGRAKRVNLIDEDDGGLVLAGHLEELPNQSE